MRNSKSRYDSFINLGFRTFQDFGYRNFGLFMILAFGILDLSVFWPESLWIIPGNGFSISYDKKDLIQHISQLNGIMSRLVEKALDSLPSLNRSQSIMNRVARSRDAILRIWRPLWLWGYSNYPRFVCGVRWILLFRSKGFAFGNPVCHWCSPLLGKTRVNFIPRHQARHD